MTYPTGEQHSWHDWMWGRTLPVACDDDNLFGCIEYHRCLHCGALRKSVKEFKKMYPGAILVSNDVSITESGFNPVPE